MPDSDLNVKRFGKVLNALISDPSLSRNSRFLYSLLSSYADGETGECWPSKKTLAQQSGCSSRLIYEWIVELELAGWLKRLPKRGSCHPVRLTTSAQLAPLVAQENAREVQRRKEIYSRKGDGSQLVEVESSVKPTSALEDGSVNANSEACEDPFTLRAKSGSPEQNQEHTYEQKKEISEVKVEIDKQEKEKAVHEILMLLGPRGRIYWDRVSERTQNDLIQRFHEKRLTKKSLIDAFPRLAAVISSNQSPLWG